jgi:hypothetical protein
MASRRLAQRVGLVQNRRDAALLGECGEWKAVSSEIFTCQVLDRCSGVVIGQIAGVVVELDSMNEIPIEKLRARPYSM